MKIRKLGTSYKFYINDNLVHTSYAMNLYGNRFGFTLYDRQSIRVGYLGIYYEDSGSTTNTTTKTNDHTSKETILFDGYTSNTNDWATTKNEKVTLEMKNGDYYFHHKRDSRDSFVSGRL